MLESRHNVRIAVHLRCRIKEPGFPASPFSAFPGLASGVVFACRPSVCGLAVRDLHAEGLGCWTDAELPFGARFVLRTVQAPDLQVDRNDPASSTGTPGMTT